jgi:peptidoglycan-N-acetylglucosamine deacetylase
VSGSSEIRVALTLDAEHPSEPQCPPDAPDRILDALASGRTRATFFLQGRWASAYPWRARRIAADGHLVGHHSHHHAPMTLLHDEGVRADVTGAADTIRTSSGVDPRPWFRCPFGRGHDDPRFLEVLEHLGYRNVHWNVEAGDWRPERTAAEIGDKTVDGVMRRGDGAVVLLHTWPGPTADAFPGMLSRLSEAGARFVGVDELEDLP